MASRSAWQLKELEFRFKWPSARNLSSTSSTISRKISQFRDKTTSLACPISSKVSGRWLVKRFRAASLLCSLIECRSVSERLETSGCGFGSQSICSFSLQNCVCVCVRVILFEPPASMMMAREQWRDFVLHVANLLINWHDKAKR